MECNTQQAEAPNKFYVYEHIRLDTGKTFYVGKGSGDRSSYHYNRNRYWSSIAKKHGYSSKITAHSLDEELAFLAEIELIDKYRRLNIRLANMTVGGDGVSLVGEAKIRFLKRCRDPDLNHKRSMAIKAALSDPAVRHRMSAGIRLAHEKDDAYRAKLRKTAKDNNSRPEVREKISLSARAYWAQPGVKEARLGPLLAASTAVCARPVLCVETGVVFKSFADAARWLRAEVNSKASHSAVVNACKGKLKSAYGYHWQYAPPTPCLAERVTMIV